MKTSRLIRWTPVLTYLVFSAAICTLASAQTGFSDLSYSADSWHVAASPYLWLAGLNGTVGFSGREVQVNQSFTDIFSNLKFGVMGLTEINRGPLSLFTDAMYIRLGNETAIPVQGLPSAVNVNTSLNTFTLTPYLGYRLFGNKRGSIQLLTGLRYYHIGVTINANAGTIASASYSTSDNWADFVQGGHFTLNITRRINAFFFGDAGLGGSLLTYQLAGGAAYEWNKKWSTSLGYRRLYFNRQTSAGLDLEPTQQGLVIGATYRFR